MSSAFFEEGSRYTNTAWGSDKTFWEFDCVKIFPNPKTGELVAFGWYTNVMVDGPHDMSMKETDWQSGLWFELPTEAIV
jgi:hypothetical protein